MNWNHKKKGECQTYLNNNEDSSKEKKAILEKIDLMALETGEHPFVFKKDGVPVFVSFPVQADIYFSPQEMTSARKIIMESESQNQNNNVVEKEEEKSLTEKISNAREAAKQVNQVSKGKGHCKNMDER